MQTFLLKYLTPALLGTAALMGLAFGHLAGTLVGMKASSTGNPISAGKPREHRTAGNTDLELHDFEVIPQRSLFAPDRPGTLSQSNQSAAAPVGKLDVTLLGTIAGGLHPLALTRVGAEARVLRVGDTLPGGKVIAIDRQSLTIRQPDGRDVVVTPPEIPAPHSATPSTANAPESTAKQTGSNRWAISKGEADKARSNLGELMKQARMEPRVVNGRTDGFEVKMVKPNTLFTTLGIQKGDVVKQVNGLQLDSPEKALQIFQQLREAQRIVIALERNGSPMSFEYDLE